MVINYGEGGGRGGGGRVSEVLPLQKGEGGQSKFTLSTTLPLFIGLKIVKFSHAVKEGGGVHKKHGSLSLKF